MTRRQLIWARILFGVYLAVVVWLCFGKFSNFCGNLFFRKIFVFNKTFQFFLWVDGSFFDISTFHKTMHSFSPFGGNTTAFIFKGKAVKTAEIMCCH